MPAIRGSARLLLIASLVAACAAPAASPGPTASPAAASLPPTAPAPTTASSPAPTATAAPAPTLTPFTFVPAGDPPSGLQTRATATAEGIRVSIELESAPLRVGQAQTVTLTVRNIGTKGARWITDGCGSPFDAYGMLTGENWIGGSTQTGIAAEFKAASLEPFGHSGDSPLSIGFRDPDIPEGAGCADIGIGHTLGPGKSITSRRTWTGDAVVAPDGPVELVASFRYAGHVGDPPDETYPATEVRLDSWLVSGFVPDFLPPGPAIDAALRDREFTDWLDDVPSSTWNNMHRTLDRDAGTWEIGLFRNGNAGFFGTVTMDARTGEVLKHRFE